MSKSTTQDFVISNDSDLPQAWNQALEECARIVGWDLGPLTCLSAEEQTNKIAEITNSISPQKADAGKASKAKRVFGDVLSGIQVFGGFVAQGAAIVFGPSQQVFNAVSFVIDASQRYQSVFDDIAKLMERLAFVFERLKIHLKNDAGVKLDKDIRPSIYRVLVEFVRIMAKTYQMTHGRFRHVKLAKEVILGNDDGISDSLYRLEMLIADTTHIQIDKIYSGMNEALRDLGNIDEKMRTLMEDTQQLVSTVGQMRNLGERKEELATVRDKLRVNKPESPDQCWEVHTTGFNDRIEDSGGWMIKSQKFQDWSNWRAQIDKKLNVLCISGPEGIGKTYVCHAILEHLQKELRRTKTDFKTYISWYYAGRDSKKSTIQKALAHMIYQLAQQDPTYLKYVHAKVKDYIGSESDDATKMWKELVVEYSKSKPRAAFFLVLDGLDQIDFGTESPLRDVLQDAISKFNDPDGLHLRVLVCGRPSAFGEEICRIHQPIDLTPTPQSITRREDDLRIFISRRLDSMGKFKASPNHQKAADLRERIMSEMPKLVKGNYKTLTLKLDEIERADSSEEIEKILAKGVVEGVERIKQEITDLNARLDHKEVARLNEILAWIAVTKEDPTVELMTSVLSSNPDNDMFDIAGNIRKQFSLLISIDEKRSDNENDIRLSRDATLTFASDDVERCLEEAEPNREPLTNAEIDIVQDVILTHFHRTFGENSSLHNKFEFAKFFKGKRDIHATLIHLDGKSQANNLRVLRSCLDALCDPAAPDRRPTLHDYASRYFDEHLVDSVLDQVEPDVKRQLGNRLIRVLCDDTVIDSYATGEQMWDLLDWFYPNDQFCDTARMWLKDEDVRIGIFDTTTERSGLEELTTPDVSKAKVLTYIARRILRQWFLSEKYTDLYVFIWLRGFWQKMTGSDDDETWILWRTPTVKEVEEWASWAKGVYVLEGAQTSDAARWTLQTARTCQMLGEAYDQKKLLKYAKSLCQAEIEKGNPMWQIRLLLAEMLHERKDDVACLEALEPILADNAELLSIDVFSQAYWTVVLPLAGKCHAKLNNMDAALECFQKALNHAQTSEKLPSDMTEIVDGTLIALLALGKLAEALEVLKHLSDPKQDNQPWLDTILGQRDGIHQHIVTLCHRSADFSTFSDIYQQALERVKTPKDSHGPMVLRLHQWRLHWHCGPPAHRDQALDEWEEMLDFAQDQELYTEAWYVVLDATVEVAHALFHKAAKSGFSSVETQQCLVRLEAFNKRGERLFESLLYRNTKVTIARLYHLSGNTDKAKAILQAEVRSAIRCITTEDDKQSGYKALGMLLAIIDDDINAKAAWSMLEPDRAVPSADVEAESSDAAVEESSSVRVAAAEDQATAFADVLDDIGMAPQVTAGAELSLDNCDNIDPFDPHEEDGTALPHETNDKPSNESSQPGPADPIDDDTDVEDLSGKVSFMCNGRCGKDWTYADDLWMCKDCLDTHLDAVCFQKLKNGTLGVDICDVSHQHLHVPPLDVQEWRSRKSETILVGGQALESSEWVKQIRVAWDLDKLENIKLYRTVMRAVTRFLQRKHKATVEKQQQDGL